MRIHQSYFEQNNLIASLAQFVLFSTLFLIPEDGHFHPSSSLVALTIILLLTVLKITMCFIGTNNKIHKQISFVLIDSTALFWSTLYLLELLETSTLTHHTIYLLFLIMGISGSGVLSLYKHHSLTYSYIACIELTSFFYTAFLLTEIRFTILIGIFASMVFNSYYAFLHYKSWQNFLNEKQKSDDLSQKLANEKKTLQDTNHKLDAALASAEEYSKLKDDFVATVSHEIRTPMNGVIGMSALLDETELSDEQKEYNTLIRHSSKALLTIINDILDFSKIEAGKLTLEETAFNLHDLLNEIILIHIDRAKASNITLRLNFPDEITGQVLGDPTRLRQILTNLIGNAIKFAKDGTVSLDVKHTPEGFFRFDVTDDGIGIHPKKIDNIFEKFTQADSSTTRRFGGTGLGLSITRELVWLMAGEIKVESSPGRGSTFSVILPLKPSKFNVENLDEPLRNQKHGVQKSYDKKVLIVDDNLINQKVASRMLQLDNLMVDVVSNGKQAVENAYHTFYGCILMDIEMPQMNGITATKEIRKSNGASQQAPIIALTANAVKGDRERYLAAGMDDYLSKPLDKEELRAKVRHWLKTGHSVPT